MIQWRAGKAGWSELQWLVECPALVGPGPNQTAAVPGSGPCRVCLSCCALLGPGPWKGWRSTGLSLRHWILAGGNRRPLHVVGQCASPGERWREGELESALPGAGAWSIQEIFSACCCSIPNCPCQPLFPWHCHPPFPLEMGTMRTDPSEQPQMVPRCVLCALRVWLTT